MFRFAKLPLYVRGHGGRVQAIDTMNQQFVHFSQLMTKQENFVLNHMWKMHIHCVRINQIANEHRNEEKEKTIILHAVLKSFGLRKP